jgi:uncharacterized protein YjbJ (UPF0337 family)
MDGNIDEAKGRVKEAAGDLTDNDDLKNEGKADQAAGKAKQVVEDVKDKGQRRRRRHQGQAHARLTRRP